MGGALLNSLSSPHRRSRAAHASLTTTLADRDKPSLLRSTQELANVPASTASVPFQCPPSPASMRRGRVFPGDHRGDGDLPLGRATLLLEDQQNPVALNLEGVPFSQKTTLIDFLCSAEDKVYRSDKFTPKSFAGACRCDSPRRMASQVVVLARRKAESARTSLPRRAAPSRALASRRAPDRRDLSETASRQSLRPPSSSTPGRVP
jgi:hypothetical protein